MLGYYGFLVMWFSGNRSFAMKKVFDPLYHFGLFRHPTVCGRRYAVSGFCDLFNEIASSFEPSPLSGDLGVFHFHPQVYRSPPLATFAMERTDAGSGFRMMIDEVLALSPFYHFDPFGHRA